MKRLSTAVAVLVAALVPAPMLSAQQAPTAQAAVPAANPADVASIDAIIHAVYDVISGPAGEKRNWDRMRSLFIPGARLIPSGGRPNGGHFHRVWSLDEYITAAGPQLENGGFFESEIGRVEERYGGVVHLMSAYESRRTKDGDVFARGVNSFQLMYDGTRWWVVTIFWEGETPGNPIPAKFLKP